MLNDVGMNASALDPYPAESFENQTEDEILRADPYGLKGNSGANKLSKRQEEKIRAANKKFWDDFSKKVIDGGGDTQNDDDPHPQTGQVKVLIVNGKAGGASDVGHTAIETPDGKVYGYYPTDENHDGTYGTSEVLRSHGVMEVSDRTTFDKTYGHDGYTEFTLNLPQASILKIQSYLEHVKADPGTYSIFGNQCTYIACRALQEGGITVQRYSFTADPGPTPLHALWLTPSELKKALEYHVNTFVAHEQFYRN